MLSRLNTTALMRASLKTTSIAAVQTRDFGAKRKKKVKVDPEQPTEYETEVEQVQTKAPIHDSAEPWKKATQVVDLDKSLFQKFDLGDIKRVDSTPDNKAPSYEDTIEGRYANVLFTTASQKGALFDVYEDLMYLSELYTHSEIFRHFTENGGVGLKEISELNKVLLSVAPFHEVTMHFLTILAENKRLVFV